MSSTEIFPKKWVRWPASSQIRKHVCMLSFFGCVQLFATLWTIAPQAPLSMGFSRQEYWSGLPCPPPGDLPDPGMEPKSLSSLALAGGSSTTWEPLRKHGLLSHWRFRRQSHNSAFRKDQKKPVLWGRKLRGFWKNEPSQACNHTSFVPRSSLPSPHVSKEQRMRLSNKKSRAYFMMYQASAQRTT